MTNYKKRMSIKRNNRQIALERISILFENAIGMLKVNPELAQYYIVVARKIGMRYKVRMPKIFKRMICKKCKGFIIPGVNCRVRTRTNREPHIIITCYNCGGYMRIPLKEKKNFDYSKTKTEN